jgi:hypothetical protein
VGAGGEHAGVSRRACPVGQGLADSGEAPRNTARAVRTALVAAPAPRWRRAREPAGGGGAWMPWSAPAAIRGRRRRRVRGASGLPGGPPSRRSCRTRSARAASASPSRSWAASSSTAAARVASPSGRPAGSVECVFGSMGATYQPAGNGKHQTVNVDNIRPPAPTSARTVRHGAQRPRPTVPGECMGPEPRATKQASNGPGTPAPTGRVRRARAREGLGATPAPDGTDPDRRVVPADLGNPRLNSQRRRADAG